MSGAPKPGRLGMIAERLANASPGPWDADCIDSEDGRGKFLAYALYDAAGETLADSQNATVTRIREEPDENGTHALDELACDNFTLIAAAREDLEWAVDLVIEYRALLQGAVSMPAGYSGAQAYDLRRRIRAALAKTDPAPEKKEPRG